TNCCGPVASPRCSLTVVASPPFSFPLYDAASPLLRCNMRARRFLFSTIPTRRTLSVTNVTSLVFIFFMSDMRNADTFDRVFRPPAELALRRNGDTLSLLITEILPRPSMQPCRPTLSGAPPAQVLRYL